MDKYVHDNNIKVITISESLGKFQGFGNYDIYRAHSNKLGCSLLIHKQLNSYEVKITPREGLIAVLQQSLLKKENFAGINIRTLRKH